MAAWYREADYKRRKTNAHNEREKARGRLNPPVPINLKPVQPKGLLTCKKNGLTSPKVGKSQPKFGKSNPKSKSLPFITKIKTALQKQQSSHPKNRENNYRKITSGGTEATGSLASGDKKAQHNKNNCQVRSFVISKNYQHEQANTTQQRANGQQPRTKLKPYGRVFFKPTLVKPAPNQRDHPLLRRNLHKFKEYLADRKNKSNCPSKVRRTLAKWDCINCPRSKDKQKQQRQQKQQKQQPQFQEAPPQPAQPQRSPTLNPTPICSSQANSPQSQNTRSRSPQSLQSPVQSPQLPTKRPQSQQTWSPIQLQSKSPTRCQSPGSKTTQSKHSQPQSPQSSKRQPDGSQSKNSQRLSASKGYQLRILTMQQRRERQAKNDEEREARKRIREVKNIFDCIWVL
uniref:Uncharacterized protein n=1 Tax=Strigamia maritima TaxID=126957 RepID=T1JDP3_STRMM